MLGVPQSRCDFEGGCPWFSGRAPRISSSASVTGIEFQERRAFGFKMRVVLGELPNPGLMLQSGKPDLETGHLNTISLHFSHFVTLRFSRPFPRRHRHHIGDAQLLRFDVKPPNLGGSIAVSAGMGNAP